MTKIISKSIIFLIVAAFVLSACEFPTTTASQPAAVSIETARIVFWSDPAALGASDVQEVMNMNAATAGWRQYMMDILAQGEVDVFIDCVDGRVGAQSQYYAKLMSDGYLAVPHLEITSLAGEVTPEIIKYLQYLNNSGWVRIRSINVSSHTCANSVCGAQGVFAEIQAGKPISEFQTHGVGEAAEWISAHVDSANPIEQVGAQVTKLYNAFNGQVTVFGWMADHGTQARELVAELYSGGEHDIAIRDELVKLNADSAAILAPQAAAQGLDKAQSFRRIVVTDWPGPVESLLEMEGVLDEAFNASVLVSPDFTDAEVEATISAARAATQYALAHANAETEFLVMFQDEVLMKQFMAALELLQAYQAFLANPEFQEVSVFKLTPGGGIRDALLVKPAHAVVTRTVGPVFRGVTISQVENDWALYQGDPANISDHAVSFRMDVNGKVLWKYTGDDLVTLERRYLGTKAYAEANGLPIEDLRFDKSDPYNPELIVPDWGTSIFEVLKAAGYPQALLDQLANQGIESMMRAYPQVALPYDMGAKQYVTGPTGTWNVDWEDALLGEEAVRKVWPTAESYYLALVGSFEIGWRYQASQIGLWHLHDIHWQLPAFASSWAGSGAAEYVSATTLATFEQAVLDLRSTSPEVVAAARNTLRSMGAFEQNGVWLIVGERSIYASAPIKLSTLNTYYPDGAKAFVGFQTRQWGVIGLERAENVPGGLFGWRMYAPRLSLQGKTIGGLPAGVVVEELVGKAMILVWVGFVVDDINDFATQTEYMALGPNTLEVFEPPIEANYQLFMRPEKWSYVTTTLQISLADLQTGCNGTGVTALCGAYLPDGQRSPIAMMGLLAGETIPQYSWPSFGLEGNSVLTTWEYEKWGSQFFLWHNNQIVEPGSVLDYYELVVNEWGMWFVPYHAEYLTATCSGLCITQAHGGEEFLFASDSQPRELDLCPEGADAVCYWRP